MSYNLEIKLVRISEVRILRKIRLKLGVSLLFLIIVKLLAFLIPRIFNKLHHRKKETKPILSVHFDNLRKMVIDICIQLKKR